MVGAIEPGLVLTLCHTVTDGGDPSSSRTTANGRCVFMAIERQRTERMDAAARSYMGGGDLYLLRCILFITRRTVAETIIANRVYGMPKLIVDVAYVIKNYGEMCTLLSHCCIDHTLCIINRAYNPRVLIILINRRRSVLYLMKHS